MMDAAGPGCVTRIWSGGPKPKGVIRFYLDESEKPAIEMPAAELIGGTGLVGPPLSQIAARGLNLYLPIPYATRKKGTSIDPGQGDEKLGVHWHNRTAPRDAVCVAIGHVDAELLERLFTQPLLYLPAIDHPTIQELPRHAARQEAF